MFTLNEEFVDVVISPDGTIKVSANGFKGTGCAGATKVFEDALGKVTSDEKTGDYYERPLYESEGSGRESARS